MTGTPPRADPWGSPYFCGPVSQVRLKPAVVFRIHLVEKCSEYLGKNHNQGILILLWEKTVNEGKVLKRNHPKPLERPEAVAQK